MVRYGSYAGPVLRYLSEQSDELRALLDSTGSVALELQAVVMVEVTASEGGKRDLVHSRSLPETCSCQSVVLSISIPSKTGLCSGTSTASFYYYTQMILRPRASTISQSLRSR
jgi:hypothetical protein